MSDGPILVISDTHFGFETESAARFQRFMTYLTNSVQSGRLIVKTSNEQSDEVAKMVLSEESLEAPQKIILLGDILDLWISRDSNTLRPYQESFNIFNSLIALNVEIVYLFGNHDCIMWKYKGKHSLPGGAFFTVYRFGYPNKKGSDGRWKGEKIGERTYFFLHGHQFDLFFRHESVLRFGNFMGFSSATAGGFTGFGLLGAIVFFLTVGVVFSPLFINWLPSLLNSITPLEQSSMIAVLTLFGGWLVGAIAFLGVLWLFTSLARWYYDYSLHPGHVRNVKNNKNTTSTLRKMIQRHIGDSNFARVARSIDADVIVCGHTHEPYIEPYTLKNGPKKLRINSGSWIVQQDNTHDTFVYIDNSGARLLQWQDDSGYVLQKKSSLL